MSLRLQSWVDMQQPASQTAVRGKSGVGLEPGGSHFEFTSCNVDQPLTRTDPWPSGCWRMAGG